MPASSDDGEDRLLPRRFVVLARLAQRNEHLPRSPEHARHTPPPDTDEAFAAARLLVADGVRGLRRLQVRAHRASVPSLPALAI